MTKMDVVLDTEHLLAVLYAHSLCSELKVDG